MKKLILILPLLIVFPLFSQQTAYEWEDLGFEKRDKNLHEEAIIAFTKAIELKPSEHSYGGRAQSYEFLGEYEKSLEDYDKAIALSNPVHIYLLSRRGRVHAHLKNNDLALKDFNEGLKIDPNATELLLNKGILLLTELNQPNEANRLISKVIQMDSTIGLAHYYQGIFFLEYLQDFKKAISSFNKSIELQSKYLDLSYIRRGHSKKMIDDFQGALNDVSMAIKLNPTAEYYNTRGLVYVKMGYHTKAYEDFNTSVKLNDVFSEGYLNRGVIKFYLNQNGCADLKKAKELKHPKAQPAIEEFCR
jgi:tetratricopeptide (TPR) repeat protein